MAGWKTPGTFWQTITRARAAAVACCTLAVAGATLAPGSAEGSENVEADASAQRLEALLKAGRFDEFVELALSTPSPASTTSAAGHVAVPARLHVEALLAVGRNAEADRFALERLLDNKPGDNTNLSAIDPGLIKLWLTARWRLGRGLDEPAVERLLDTHDAAALPVIASLRFWRQSLAGAEPYRRQGPAERSVAPLDVTQRLNAVESLKESPREARRSYPLASVALDVNGVRLARAFVDTGAQHTLLTRAAAASAGVEMAPDAVAMVGFSKFPARPAILRRLRLGDFVLADVPVYVGDSPALVQADGQMSLGIDIMHHVRFVMDYPASQLWVESARTGGSPEPVAEPTDGDGVWTIPLWTFSQSCLTQARMPDGSYARTLIDTGNRQGTYLSPRWARRALSDFQPVQQWFVHRYRLGRYAIAWELGGKQFRDWRIYDTLPPDLERLDLIDVLVGSDLLSHYRVEIDLPGRNLRLTQPAGGKQPSR